MLLEVWREAVRTFAPILSRRNIQERRLEFITGGLLEFWSLDNPDVARGRKYRRIIVDEAAMVPSLMDVWQYALRPTLADYQGDAWFVYTEGAQRFLADVAMGTGCRYAGVGKLANAVKRQSVTCAVRTG